MMCKSYLIKTINLYKNNPQNKINVFAKLAKKALANHIIKKSLVIKNCKILSSRYTKNC